MFLAVLATMMVPFQMYVIPLYLMMRNMRLVNTLTALIIPWGVNAFGVFLMRQFMLTIPKDLIDAARIDGASELRTFFQIVLPLSRSALSSLAVLMALFIWDELFWALIVIDDITKRPVSLGLALFQQNYGPLDWHIIMAGATVAALPILVLFLLAQRTFIQGITMTGVKE
jgi:multiple sugar transport system permease protein